MALRLNDASPHWLAGECFLCSQHFSNQCSHEDGWSLTRADDVCAEWPGQEVEKPVVRRAEQKGDRDVGRRRRNETTATKQSERKRGNKKLTSLMLLIKNDKHHLTSSLDTSHAIAVRRWRHQIYERVSSWALMPWVRNYSVKSD